MVDRSELNQTGSLMESPMERNKLTSSTHLLTRCINMDCEREIYLVAPFPFYEVSTPMLACSADCLMVWEKSARAWMEKGV